MLLHNSEEDIPSIARSSTSYGRLDPTIVGGGLLRTGISTANGGEATTIVDRVGEGGGFMTSMMGNIICGSVLSFFVVGVSFGDIHKYKSKKWLASYITVRIEIETCLKFFVSLKIIHPSKAQTRKKKAMSEEPPRKKRRQTMNQTFDANRSKDSVKHAKRVQSASDPTQMPQAHNSSQFSLIFSEKVLSTTGTCECPL